MRDLEEIFKDIESAAKKTGSEAAEFAKRVKVDLSELGGKAAGKTKEEIEELKGKLEDLVEKTEDEAAELSASIKKELSRIKGKKNDPDQ